MSNQMPQGWIVSTVGEVADVIGGLTKNAKREALPNHRPYLRVANVYANRLALDEVYTIGIEDGEVKRASLRPGDLLVVEGNGSPDQIGRVALWNGEIPNAVHQNHIIKVRFRDGIAPSFALWWFIGPQGRTAIQAVASSTSGLFTLSISKIQELPLPIAPLREQQRVVDALEEHLSELDASVASLERAERNLVRYRSAVLAAACSGKLVPTEAELAQHDGRGYESADETLSRITGVRCKSNTNMPKLPQGWAWTNLESLAAHERNSVTDGPFGSKLKTEHYTASGPRVIRLQNIGDGQFVDAYSHISPEHFATLLKHQVYPGDVVIGALGNRPPRSCIIPESVGPAVVKADCIRFKPHSKLMLPAYLNHALNSTLLKGQGEAIVHGVGRPRLNLGEILGLLVPVPPLAEQMRIVAEVDRHLSRADALAASIAQAKRRAQRLRRAILAAAFQGRLVPQDPNDEPASVLLDRIRARAVAPIATPPDNDAGAKRRGRPPGSPNKANRIA